MSLISPEPRAQNHKWGAPVPHLVMSKELEIPMPSLNQNKLSSHLRRFCTLKDSVWSLPIESGSKAASRADIRQVLFNLIVEICTLGVVLSDYQDYRAREVTQTRVLWYNPKPGAWKSDDTKRYYLLLCPGSGREPHVHLHEDRHRLARLRPRHCYDCDGATGSDAYSRNASMMIGRFWDRCRVLDSGRIRSRTYQPRLAFARQFLHQTQDYYEVELRSRTNQPCFALARQFLHQTQDDYEVELTSFLNQTRMFRTKKCWLLYQVLKCCYGRLRTDAVLILKDIGIDRKYNSTASLLLAKQALLNVKY
ncbi:hypothetical protein BJ508DRAFT_160860 [Ascobolus immersus RN42]|uniref:Uncharacterized protein n=1 Tax=Ascobolus immersus RN42 TaxID=1160509 RepID=A0A3N4HWM3_ASCIM|nr:hypothetical protein BJ508DRAFT_160860 [Ascobolus immersus RN42]